jgi:DNA-binding NarL/FixJ family response regulator
MIHILIAEDHALVREGLCRILETEQEFRVIGEAATGLEAVDKTESSKPDVLLLDLTLPFLHGLDILARLKSQKRTRVLVVSMHGDEPSVVQALRLGARGYLLKESPARQLISAIKTIHGGGHFISPSLEPIVHRAMTGRGAGNSPQGSSELTRREISVLQQVASGESSGEIAKRLGISISTVAKHRANIMRKTESKTQADMVLFAIRHKLIDP